MKRDTIFICPNPHCTYEGKPYIEGYGSWIIMVCLLICGIVPGIFYGAVWCGEKYICPHCKMVLDRST